MSEIKKDTGSVKDVPKQKTSSSDIESIPSIQQGIEKKDLGVKETGPRREIEKMIKKDTHWDPVVKALENEKISGKYIKRTMESFEEPPDVKKLTKDKDFNRYYKGASRKIARSLTKDNLATSVERKEKLALPPYNSGEKKARLTVEKGAVILDGKAKGLYGYKGGGNQIYVPDITKIKEVNSE